jgi:hypothetical protein
VIHTLVLLIISGVLDSLNYRNAYLLLGTCYILTMF